MAEFAQRFLYLMCRGDFNSVYEIVEKPSPTAWIDKEHFIQLRRKEQGGGLIVRKAERYQYFGRVWVEWHGEPLGWVYLVQRPKGWKVTYINVLIRSRWQEFFSSYVYDLNLWSAETPELRDQTKEIGEEILRLIDLMLTEWKNLQEGGPERKDLRTVLYDLMKSNYLPVRHKAYELLVKRFGYEDRGIGDEFVGREGEPPAWYKRWFYTNPK